MTSRVNALNLPKDFWQELDKSNAIKDKNAPVALVMRGAYDFNGVLSSTPTQSLLLQLAKTHRIAIETIDRGKLFGQKIQETSLREGRKISLLMILAHGYPHQIEFGKNEFYQEADLDPKDFLQLHLDAKIILYSCNTGQGLAQKIANVAKRTVYAPVASLYDAATCLLSEPNHSFQMLSYDEAGLQHVHAFKPNRAPELLLPQHLDSIAQHQSFCVMASYLKKKAEASDPDAQCKLGLFYLNGRGGLPQSDQEAARWFRLAADQGVALAQLNLGNFYLIGRGGLVQSDREAERYFRLAAIQGMAPAYHSLGVFYLMGRGGLDQSDEQAAKCFFLAASEGVSDAVYNLGVLYEHGRGVPQSVEIARHLYEAAAQLGVAEASKRLENCANAANF